MVYQKFILLWSLFRISHYEIPFIVNFRSLVSTETVNDIAFTAAAVARLMLVTNQIIVKICKTTNRRKIGKFRKVEIMN